MLYFQVVLLVGYAYAHFSTRWLKPRVQAILHSALLLAALVMLPITPTDSWKPSASENPVPRILALLTVTLGLPYFVLSSTGPLMQQWFSRTNPGRSPYRLFALSNAGSLLALVSYPFFFETHFTRKIQAEMWGWGLEAFVLFCGFSAFQLWKSSRLKVQSAVATEAARKKASANPGPGAGTQLAVSAEMGSEPRGYAAAPEVVPANPSSAPGVRPSFLDRVSWLLLAACASVLLLAVTNKMCQDVAVIPFLWVLPLGLYLLSFIISFDNPRWYQRLIFTPALVAALAATYWALRQGVEAPLPPLLVAYSSGLFVCCMVCHGELYRLKPEPRYLTSFYLVIAAGGALGGVLVAIVAPLIFKDYYELHLGMLLCGFLFLLATWRRKDAVSQSEFWRRVALPALSVALVVLGFGLRAQARRFSDLVAERTRTFYGVLTVFEAGKFNPDLHHFSLAHGNIRHGLQMVHPVGATWPTVYYNSRSGAGLAIPALGRGPRRIALVGLGIGTLAAYSRTNDYFRGYEINPEVIRLAKSRFKYLSNCQGKVELVPGDARLSLEREPPQHFDLIALDTFSGDAIPTHLLTREAFALYDRHLNTNGVIAVHITNHYLDLEPVLANVAAEFRYNIAVIECNPRDPAVVAASPGGQTWWIYYSVWVLLTRDPHFLETPTLREVARPPQTKIIPLWTDDFSSLYQILR